jgi:hypothetical protein
MQFSPVNPGPRWTEELPVSLAAVSSSISQANNTNPEFGQGLKRYSKRYAAGITDQVLGKVMTEALYPTLFREYPLYFRINGSVKNRLLLGGRAHGGHENKFGKRDLQFRRVGR